MKRAKKIIAVFLGVLLLISCLTATAFAAETNTQDGLTAVIQTDKESYSANEDIHITVTVTNNNSFEVKNVSIESFLPDTLTLKDGDLKSKTVDLQSGETLTLAYVAILEKEEQSSSENETSESTTEETTTEITETTETATETTEQITDETSTAPDTTTSETEPDDILPIEPSTNESNPDATTESVSQENNPTSPDTGDNSPFVKILIALIIAMAIIAAYIIITKKNNKKATKVISLVLCGAIAISSVATIGFIKVGAEGGTQLSFSVDKTIIVNREVYTFSANISYDISKDTIKLESDPTDLSIDNIPKNVLFYIDLENTTDTYKVTLVNANDGKKVVDMKDDGSNGDQKAKDGIYSATTSVDCSEEKILEYYAVISDGSSFVTSMICKINVFAPLTDKEAESMETVDERLSDLTGALEYQNMDEHSRKEAIEILLNELANEGLVIKKSIYYDDINKMYSFSYDCMIQGAVALYPSKNSSDEPATWSNSTSITTAYSEIKSKLQVPETNRRNLGECTIYYGAGIDDTKNYNFYNRLQKTLNSRGLDTVMDVDVTVSDLKNIDRDNEVCIIASHGLYYTYTYRTGFLWLDKVTLENPMICLNEITSKDKDKEYQADIKSKRILKITISGETYYWIYPELIESAYSSNDLEGMILAATCCEFMGKDENVDTSMANAFTNSGVETILGFYNSVYCDYANNVIETFIQELINGRTAIQSYNQALKQWGANDAIWYESAGYTGTPSAPAKPILYGDNQDIILNTCTGTIIGTVKDKTTGTPISNVKVYVEENEVVTSSCYTNENGGFELALPVGHHILHYSHDNYEHAMNGFDIEKDTTTVIMEPVCLTPKSGNVTGVVKDKVTDVPISDVTLEVIDNSAGNFETIATTTTNENGGFSLNLPAGSYSVSFNHPDYVYQGISVDIEKDTTTVIMEPIYLTPKDTETPEEPEDPENPEGPEFAGGDGTIENPYQISTPEQLNAVRNDLDAHYIQINDIDMSGWGNWEPIGQVIPPYSYKSGTDLPYDNSAYFSGSYNGKNYSINNLKINNSSVTPSTDCYGLFAGIKNAVIENVNLNIDYQIEKGSTDYENIFNETGIDYSICVGGIVGRSSFSSRISNCFTSGNINVSDISTAYIGGIIGFEPNTIGSDPTVISSCRNNIDICVYGAYIQMSPTIYVGGIGGYGFTISQCENQGDIGVTNGHTVYCGGIIGNTHYDTFDILSLCKNSGNITVASKTFAICGGIAGYQEMQISKCINYGNISGKVTNSTGYFVYGGGNCDIGGITGRATDNIDTCINHGNISSVIHSDYNDTKYTKSYAGGIVGYLNYNINNPSKISNCCNLAEKINAYTMNNIPRSAGRIAGYSRYISDCYSVNTTTLNRTIPTEYTQADQINGASLTKEEIEEKIEQIDFGNMPKA